jgi:hypothetical protein
MKKRGASSDPEGAPQRSEKAVKESDAEPQLVQTDPLLELLCTFTAEDKARRWKDVLDGRDVVSRDSLLHLAQAEEAWNAFYAALAQQEPVLAAELNTWRLGLGLREPSAGNSPGKQQRLIFSPFLSAFASLRSCAPLPGSSFMLCV